MWSPLIVAALRGHDDAVKLLLENGADVGLTDTTKSSALHAAAGYGRLKMVRMLLEAKADVNGRDAGGSTPMHVAAQSGQCEVSGGATAQTHQKAAPHPVRPAISPTSIPIPIIPSHRGPDPSPNAGPVHTVVRRWCRH